MRETLVIVTDRWIDVHNGVVQWTLDTDTGRRCQGVHKNAIGSLGVAWFVAVLRGKGIVHHLRSVESVCVLWR